MTRKQVLQKAIAGELTWIQAAEVLRLTPRQVRRIRKRFDAGGEAALLDLRLGKKNPRRIPEHFRKQISEIYRAQYSDFSVLHFYEKLTTIHKIQVGTYETIKRILQETGAVTELTRRSSHRKRRERRPMSGMLLHLDGSTHAWFGLEHPNCDLLAVIDDATSKVYAAEFVNQEGSRTCMGVLKETIAKNGVFCSLYTDRAMHFVITTKAGEKPDRSRKSQIGLRDHKSLKVIFARLVQILERDYLVGDTDTLPRSQGYDGCGK
jgi:hypothetical protein